MKYTLLQMVQRVLASMDSDDVDSITDTTESQQVALLIEGVYNDLISEFNLPTTGTLFQLNGSGTSLKPVLMTIPEQIISLEWVKYDKQTTDDDGVANYQDVDFMELKDFLSLTNGYRNLDDYDSMDHSITNGDNTDTITFYFRTDVGPTYYTSFDDGTLIFDSYDSSIDTSTLEKSKTQCWGSLFPDWTEDDDFTPNLNTEQFSLLLNEAKARAFVELKQASNTNAEGHARRLMVRLRNSKRKSPHDPMWPLSALPDYGRK